MFPAPHVNVELLNRLPKLQYCAKEMRAKCANFVLCLRVFSKKIRPKIRASFRNVLNVVSLKQRSKIRAFSRLERKFLTRGIIALAECEISQCSELTSIEPTTFRSLVNNRGHVDALLLAVVYVLIPLSWRRISIL